MAENVPSQTVNEAALVNCDGAANVNITNSTVIVGAGGVTIVGNELSGQTSQTTSAQVVGGAVTPNRNCATPANFQESSNSGGSNVGIVGVKEAVSHTKDEKGTAWGYVDREDSSSRM